LKFLNDVTTHPDAILTHSASNVHSDTSYLCKSKAKSRTGGYFFLSSNAEDPRDNEAVLNIAIFEECDVIGSRSGNCCTIFLIQDMPFKLERP
jgi:hypothetical protein